MDEEEPPPLGVEDDEEKQEEEEASPFSLHHCDLFECCHRCGYQYRHYRSCH